MNLGELLRDLADDLETALDAGDDDLAGAIVADLRSVGRGLPDVDLAPAFCCAFCSVVRDTAARLELHVEQTHRRVEAKERPANRDKSTPFTEAA